MLHAVQALADDPEAGAQAQDLEPVGAYRHWVISSFRLICRIKNQRVEVLRLWDARQGSSGLQTAVEQD